MKGDTMKGCKTELFCGSLFTYDTMSVEGLCVAHFIWIDGTEDISIYDPNTCKAFVHILEVPKPSLRDRVIELGVPACGAAVFVEELKQCAEAIGSTPETLLAGTVEICYNGVPLAKDRGLRAVIMDGFLEYDARQSDTTSDKEVVTK